MNGHTKYNANQRQELIGNLEWPWLENETGRGISYKVKQSVTWQSQKWIYSWMMDKHSKNSKESLEEKGTDWEIQTLIMIVLYVIRMW